MGALLVLAGMTSGCWLCLDCMPVASVLKDGLGLSDIGDYIRMHTRMGVNEVALGDGLADLIAQGTPPNGLSREDAESLGMQCEPAPSTECAFLAEWSFRSAGIPGRDKKIFIHNIEVRFSYLKPQALVVKAREREIPEE
jgi:hypothetical protein